MELRAADIPRPISIMDGRGGTGRANRSTAGTKEKCIYCQRKTYRYIGSRPVCSMCDAAHREELERRWTPSLP